MLLGKNLIITLKISFESKPDIKVAVSSWNRLIIIGWSWIQDSFSVSRCFWFLGLWRSGWWRWWKPGLFCLLCYTFTVFPSVFVLTVFRSLILQQPYPRLCQGKMFCFMLRHPEIQEQPWDSAQIKGPLSGHTLNMLTCSTRAMVRGGLEVMCRQQARREFKVCYLTAGVREDFVTYSFVWIGIHCCTWLYLVLLVGQRPLLWRKIVAALEEAAVRDKTKHCASAKVQTKSQHCEGIFLFLPLHFPTTLAWQQ